MIENESFKDRDSWAGKRGKIGRNRLEKIEEGSPLHF
jgi:hypothetical protein